MPRVTYNRKNQDVCLPVSPIKDAPPGETFHPLITMRNLRGNAWDQFNNEPNDAYELFNKFRLMNKTERNWIQTNMSILARENFVTVAYVQMLSVQYMWEVRLRFWEEHIANELTRGSFERRMKKLNQMYKRQMDMGKSLQEKAMRRWKELDETSLRPRDMVNIIELGARLERLARQEQIWGPAGIRRVGDINVSMSQTQNNFDVSKLTDEELRMIISGEENDDERTYDAGFEETGG
jgi:hypothetical protein